MLRGINGEVATTIDGHYYLGCGNRGGREREIVYGGGENMNAQCLGNGQPNQLMGGDCTGALNCMHDQQAVVTTEPTYMSDRKGHNGITEDGTATTLTAQEKERPMVGSSTVRRLTPLECTRLQGFPDGWVEIGEWTDSKGKKHKDADSPKYKALGNSIALPYWEWLARKIAAEYERPVTLGSLFDGIGGFPLAFQRAGGIPVWASEIEEFPMAVTKKHFGED